MMAFFLHGIFLGVAAATRRNDHLYLAVLAESMTGWRRLFFELFNRGVVLVVALCFVVYGYKNFLDGFISLRMPSMTPMAWFYIAIPISGVLVALFTIEQMVNGWKHGFANPTGVEEEKRQSL
jgi:TRAP-type C4-dicarboxylate transport system permease small subunit